VPSLSQRKRPLALFKNILGYADHLSIGELGCKQLSDCLAPIDQSVGDLIIDCIFMVKICETLNVRIIEASIQLFTTSVGPDVPSTHLRHPTARDITESRSVA